MLTLWEEKKLTDIIVGLDIGTSNIRVAIAEILEDNSLQVIGLAVKPSNGVRSGSIVNIEAVIESIKAAIEDVEQEAGVDVIDCIAAIGGSQIESYNSHGLAAILSKNQQSREITQSDKEKALESARATLILSATANGIPFTIEISFVT